jgi:hypothetical protein
VGRNKAESEWWKHAIENHIVEDMGRLTKIFCWDPAIQKALVPVETIEDRVPDMEMGITLLEEMELDEAFIELPKQNQLTVFKPIVWVDKVKIYPQFHELLPNIQQKALNIFPNISRPVPSRPVLL